MTPEDRVPRMTTKNGLMEQRLKSLLREYGEGSKRGKHSPLERRWWWGRVQRSIEKRFFVLWFLGMLRYRERRSGEHEKGMKKKKRLDEVHAQVAIEREQQEKKKNG